MYGLDLIIIVDCIFCN